MKSVIQNKINHYLSFAKKGDEINSKAVTSDDSLSQLIKSNKKEAEIFLTELRNAIKLAQSK
jgi:hypothetical protein